MIIRNTRYEARHPWPEATYIQGGERGVVISEDGNHYGTAFVEAFPEHTFLRGEGKTLEEAEDHAWKQYERYRDCDGNLKFGEWHGPYERRQYSNGAGFCTRCGIWMNRVLPPIPAQAAASPSLLEKALQGNTEAALEIIDHVVNADNLPDKGEA